ncbi:MAG: WXG100 family type VII secretion target [Anaerolineales bacterium]|nr:WXG100 family type VII secretion target [Anaerolineales bacterium]
MAEILVKPAELKQTSTDLRKAASVIQNAVEQVDTAIKSLGPSRFEGNRADTLRANYQRLRDKIYSFKPLIDAFANELDQAASRFEAADRTK